MNRTQHVSNNAAERNVIYFLAAGRVRLLVSRGRSLVMAIDDVTRELELDKVMLCESWLRTVAIGCPECEFTSVKFSGPCVCVDMSEGDGEEPIMTPPRTVFESLASSSPYEKNVTRFPEDDSIAWPGVYRDLDVDFAWRMFQAGYEAAGAVESLDRAVLMLDAYVECIKSDGHYELWHYIPEVEEVRAALARLSEPPSEAAIKERQS